MYLVDTDVISEARKDDKPNPLDRQIAATALIYDLIVVTRNIAHYQSTGVQLINPFT